jgi:hypothetical protein
MAPLARDAAAAKRRWLAFAVGMWALVGAGAVLLLTGLFWLGALALLGAAFVRIAWDDWARREQARFETMPGLDD